MADLLDAVAPQREVIRPGMVLLRGFSDPAALLPLVSRIAAVAPFRNMVTPGGHTMSVAMTNAGERGWVSDRTGYRYDRIDPLTERPWPALPRAFLDVARAAAAAAGFAGFRPDACLINRYGPGSRLTAHQDRNERDFTQPIVSVSLGLPATFFVHAGESREGPARPVPLTTGDVVVWGGPARLAFHGVRDLKPGEDELAGPFRYNLTMRRAG